MKEIKIGSIITFSIYDDHLDEFVEETGKVSKADKRRDEYIIEPLYQGRRPRTYMIRAQDIIQENIMKKIEIQEDVVINEKILLEVGDVIQIQEKRLDEKVYPFEEEIYKFIKKNPQDNLPEGLFWAINGAISRIAEEDYPDVSDLFATSRLLKKEYIEMLIKNLKKLT